MAATVGKGYMYRDRHVSSISVQKLNSLSQLARGCGHCSTCLNHKRSLSQVALVLFDFDHALSRPLRLCQDSRGCPCLQLSR